MLRYSGKQWSLGMVKFMYNDRRMEYKYSVSAEDIFERLIKRLYGISFGDEEYIDGFKLTKGICVELIDEKDTAGSNYRIEVDKDKKKIVIIRNLEKSGNLCWYSFVHGNIELKEELEAAIKDLVHD